MSVPRSVHRSVSLLVQELVRYAFVKMSIHSLICPLMYLSVCSLFCPSIHPYIRNHSVKIAKFIAKIKWNQLEVYGTIPWRDRTSIEGKKLERKLHWKAASLFIQTDWKRHGHVWRATAIDILSYQQYPVIHLNCRIISSFISAMLNRRELIYT